MGASARSLLLLADDDDDDDSGSLFTDIRGTRVALSFFLERKSVWGDYAYREKCCIIIVIVVVSTIHDDDHA